MQGFRPWVLAASIIVLIALSPSAESQVVRTLGSNGSASNTFPFNYSNRSGRFQTAYSAQELNLATGGQLTLVEVRNGNNLATIPSYTELRLRIGHSTYIPGGSDITASFDNNYTGSLTTVLGPDTFQPQDNSGWLAFPCNAATFQYNGTSSLLVDWSYTGRSGTGWSISSASGRNRVYLNGGNYQSTSGTASNSGNYDIRFTFQIGPQLTLTVNPSTGQMVYSNASGPNGHGVDVGSFDIACTSQADGTMTEIEVEAAGTAFASSALSELKVYRDTNSNGQFDFGTDAEVGTAGMFSGTPERATLPVTMSEQVFALNESRKYFILVKLAGTAAPTETLDFLISDITAAGQTQIAGVPSVAMSGVIIEAPEFVVSDDSSAMQGDAILGSTGNVLQKFTIGYADGPINYISQIQLEASGSGDDGSGYSQLRLYQDDGDDQFNAAQDQEVSTANFSVDNGDLTFTLNTVDAAFTAGTTKTYFVTGDFNFSSSHGDTYATQVTGIDGYLPRTIVTGTPAPTGGASAGVSILGNVIRTTLHGPSAPAVIDTDSLGSTGYGEVLLSISFQSTNEDWNIPSLTFRASGSGDDSIAFSALQLYEDANPNGIFDGAASDIAVSQLGTSFNADDGTWTADLQNALFSRNAGDRHFFLVGTFSGAARVGDTFQFSLESISGTPPANGIQLGIPSAAGESFEIDQPEFDVTLNGPSVAASINNSSLAQLLYDVTLNTKNERFTISSLTFTASGSGDDAAAFAEIALYLDDGDGVFSFANDSLATDLTASGFSADNGTYQAVLSNSDFSLPAQRRYFLVASLNGTALSGDSFQVELTAVNATSLSNTAPSGVPAGMSAGFVIDNPVLTVANASTAPSNLVMEKTGDAFSHLLGAFQISAVNGSVTLNAISFNLIGTADWLNAVDPANGVQLWLDDGDRTFDESSDTLIGQSGGVAGALRFTFAPAQVVGNNASITTWLRINVLASAGGAVPQTFVASVSAPANVEVGNGVAVMFGAPAPTSSTLTLVEYFVQSFSPLRVAAGSFGDAIEIVGSGFTSPVSLTIGGVAAGGSGSVSPDGTMITGFTVPEGMGSNLEIQLTTGLLGSRTLTQRFAYASAESGGGGGGGCALDSASSFGWLWLIALAGLTLLVYRRRLEA